MNEIRTLDLFSGIGGFALGLRRAGGFKTVCYVEIEKACQDVLQARQRDGALDLAPIWDDVTKFDGKPWRGHESCTNSLHVWRRKRGGLTRLLTVSLAHQVERAAEVPT